MNDKKVVSFYGNNVNDILKSIVDDDAIELVALYKTRNGKIQAHWTSCNNFFEFIGKLRVLEYDMISATKVD